MAEPTKSGFRSEASDEEIADEFEELCKALHHHVEDFAEEHDLSHGFISLLSMRLSVTTRMLDYVTSVEKPSTAGLKLELDRLRREFDDVVRMARKGAEEFIAATKEAIADGDGPPEQA